jgi:hypothetical protein
MFRYLKFRWNCLRHNFCPIHLIEKTEEFCEFPVCPKCMEKRKLYERRRVELIEKKLREEESHVH